MRENGSARRENASWKAAGEGRCPAVKMEQDAETKVSLIVNILDPGSNRSETEDHCLRLGAVILFQVLAVVFSHSL